MYNNTTIHHFSYNKMAAKKRIRSETRTWTVALYLVGKPYLGKDQAQLAILNGYILEEHTVKTKDGFNLILHRIPYGKNNTNASMTAGIPILLSHSLFSNSRSFIDNSEDSLGFILANEHYDVWMGNIRGNTGSWHDKYTRNDPEFWNYSWQDIAEYDLPAMIDYIQNKTKYSKILYLGFSQGSTIGFALFSDKPEYNDKVAGFVALGPVIVPRYITGLVMKLFADNHYTLKLFFNRFNIFVVTPSPQFIMKFGSIYTVFDNSIIYYFLTIFSGYGFSLYNKTRVAIYIRDGVESTSVKNFDHYLQSHTKNFAKFDYDKITNLNKYSTETPPEYNTRNISIPVALFSGANDPLSTPLDVVITSRRLKNVIVNEIVSETMFNHLNFAWCQPSRTILYDSVIKALRQMWDINGGQMND